MPETPRDPIQDLHAWFKEAETSGAPMPDAITLATATRDGAPSARMVLYKGLTPQQEIRFVTNYGSRKADELETNPRAALVFYWAKLERQIRVEGRVERAPAAESDAYWNSRPRGSNISAWSSPQSSIVQDRAELETLVADTEKKFAGIEYLPRPEFWGGYHVVPRRIEFWQGRPNRLHDRLVYTRGTNGQWLEERLAP
jgi:pyridoxamine 5'-phosphate oxidase